MNEKPETFMSALESTVSSNHELTPLFKKIIESVTTQYNDPFNYLMNLLFIFEYFLQKEGDLFVDKNLITSEEGEEYPGMTEIIDHTSNFFEGVITQMPKLEAERVYLSGEELEKRSVKSIYYSDYIINSTNQKPRIITNIKSSDNYGEYTEVYIALPWLFLYADPLTGYINIKTKNLDHILKLYDNTQPKNKQFQLMSYNIDGIVPVSDFNDNIKTIEITAIEEKDQMLYLNINTNINTNQSYSNFSFCVYLLMDQDTEDIIAGDMKHVDIEPTDNSSNITNEDSSFILKIPFRIRASSKDQSNNITKKSRKRMFICLQPVDENGNSLKGETIYGILEFDVVINNFSIEPETEDVNPQLS